MSSSFCAGIRFRSPSEYCGKPSGMFGIGRFCGGSLPLSSRGRPSSRWRSRLRRLRERSRRLPWRPPPSRPSLPWPPALPPLPLLPPLPACCAPPLSDAGAGSLVAGASARGASAALAPVASEALVSGALARLARGLRTRFSAVSPDSPTVGASVLSDKCDSSLGCERPERAEEGLEQERGCGGHGGRGVSGARRPVPVSQR